MQFRSPRRYRLRLAFIRIRMSLISPSPKSVHGVSPKAELFVDSSQGNVPQSELRERRHRDSLGDPIQLEFLGGSVAAILSSRRQRRQKMRRRRHRISWGQARLMLDLRS